MLMLTLHEIFIKKVIKYILLNNTKFATVYLEKVLNFYHGQLFFVWYFFFRFKFFKNKYYFKRNIYFGFKLNFTFFLFLLLSNERKFKFIFKKQFLLFKKEIAFTTFKRIYEKNKVNYLYWFKIVLKMHKLFLFFFKYCLVFLNYFFFFCHSIKIYLRLLRFMKKLKIMLFFLTKQYNYCIIRINKKIVKNKIKKQFVKKYIKKLNFLQKVSGQKNDFFLSEQIKKGGLWRDIRRLNYFLVLKPTLNNLFVYVYFLNNSSKYVVKKKKSKLALVNFLSCSLGVVGYKGPSKKGDIAAFDLGKKMSSNLLNNDIFCVNLVLRTKPNKKIREFFRGFKEMPLLIKNVYFMPKFAHNGCRLKKKKRL